MPSKDNRYYQSYRPELPKPQPPRRGTPLDVPPKKRSIVKRILLTFLITLLVALILALSVAGWIGYRLFSESTKVFGGTPVGNAVKTFSATELKQDAGVTNILLIGNSIDDPGHSAAELTDSILLMSINSNNNTAFTMSIPRDLLVDLPLDYGYRKINEAYFWGSQEKFNEAEYPAGGVGMLEKVVSDSFGIPIHYYVLSNYAAVRDTVNAVGGVDVTIASPDPRGIYDPNISNADGGPLKLPNGTSHIDGQTALNLTRARGNPSPDGRISYGFPRSDIDRGNNQRALLAAIKAKLASQDVLFSPSALSRVFGALAKNIQTDLEINEAKKLADTIRDISDANFKSVSLIEEKKSYLRGYTTRGGQSALIPQAGLGEFEEIQQYIDSLTQSSAQ